MKPAWSELWSVAAGVALVLTPACGGRGGDGTPPVAVATVTITPPATPIVFGALGRSVQLAAQARDAAGAVIAGASIAWSSSNPAAVTVSGSGLLTAVANGSAQVTAASGGQASTAVTIAVQQVPVSLTLSPASVSFGALGSTRQVTATLADSGGAALSAPAPTWTITNRGTASVSAAGLVTALAVTPPGQGDSIRATVVTGGTTFITPAAVLVSQIPATVLVTSTSPTPDTLFTTGRTRQFSAVASDSNANTMASPVFTWSSSAPGVATVDGTGLVTAAGDGSTNVAATTGGRSGARPMLVRRYPATFSIGPTSASIGTAAGTQLFTGVAQDSAGNVVTIAWASSNTGVLTVAPASGTTTTAKAVADGTANVVMTSGTRAVSASVTVTNQPVVSFATQVQPILTANCALSGCHVAPSPTGSQNLSAGQAYAQIVNVMAVGLAGQVRVIPGDADNSYLIRKLEGGPNIAGSRMPDGLPALPPATIQIIRTWISQGALNN